MGPFLKTKKKTGLRSQINLTSEPTWSQQSCWLLNAVWLDTKIFVERTHNVSPKETTSNSHGSIEWNCLGWQSQPQKTKLKPQMAPNQTLPAHSLNKAPKGSIISHWLRLRLSFPSPSPCFSAIAGIMHASPIISKSMSLGNFMTRRV